MKEFIPIIRYVCKHCKEDFKTTTRHDCKRDPEKKNCFTCKHNKGWDQTEIDEGYTGFGHYSRKEWSVACAMDHEDRSAPNLSSMGYKLNCPEWEQKEEAQ